jgi:processive 1,2-diacylglycerol beta-glucosyltransferase
MDNGVDPAKIEEFGIPIDPKFCDLGSREELCVKIGVDEDVPCVLIMGGTQGLGPIKDVARALDASDLNLQVMIVTGTNRKIYRWLRRRCFRKRYVILPFAENVNELMRLATVIITKPGGMTTAEALAIGVPMLILHPLPGQEAMNTKFLLREGVAVKAESRDDVVVLLEELLYNESKLRAMSRKARALSRPDSAMNIARLSLALTS